MRCVAYYFLLLLVYLVEVRSWEEIKEPVYKNIDRHLECQKREDIEKYKDATVTTCKKTPLSEEGDCSLLRNGACDESDCSSEDNEEDDQSALLMLGQEDEDFPSEDAAATEDCHHQDSETDTCKLRDSHQHSPEALHGNEFTSKSDVKYDSAEHSQEPEHVISEEIESDLDATSVDVPTVDGSANRESEKQELDLEQENVPLREILLKLKPEGLTDDEDEHMSDYSTTEANIEDQSEVEEEALVSSGSPEKQEQNLDSNGTRGTSDGGGASTTTGSKKAVCSETNSTEPINDVEIINATALLKLLQVDPNVTSRSSSGPCYLIYFFSPYCPFSIMGSPYVNALARSLRNIPTYGLDSIEHHSVNARYGVMGTPTLLLFHNGNGVGRYNASEYSVSQLMSFIRHYTDQELTDINVTSSDFRAKLPSQLAEARPYALWAAWIFLLSFASWLFLTSELCARLTEAILNNWREAEAQNDHQD